MAGRARRHGVRPLRHGRRPDGQDHRHGQHWGAFLDSALDRLGDAAVFGGILLYFTYREDSTLWAAIALAGLVFGQWTSYVKARAESLGFTCSGGLAARADRLVIILAGALLAGLGVPYVLEVAVAVLAVTSMITVVQRIVQVRRQAKAADVAPPDSRRRPIRKLSDAVRDRALRAVYRGGWRVAPRMPLPLVRGRHRVRRPGRSRVDGPHVRHAAPQPDPRRRPAGRRPLLRAGVASYLRTSTRCSPCPAGGPRRCAARVDTVNERSCARPTPGPGRSSPCRTAATGTWPAPGPASPACRSPPSPSSCPRPSSRPSSPSASGLGMEVLSHRDRPPSRPGRATSARGRLVCLVADRDLPGRGVAVDLARPAGHDARPARPSSPAGPGRR